MYHLLMMLINFIWGLLLWNFITIFSRETGLRFAFPPFSLPPLSPLPPSTPSSFLLAVSVACNTGFIDESGNVPPLSMLLEECRDSIVLKSLADLPVRPSDPRLLLWARLLNITAESLLIICLFKSFISSEFNFSTSYAFTNVSISSIFPALWEKSFPGFH